MFLRGGEGWESSPRGHCQTPRPRSAELSGSPGWKPALLVKPELAGSLSCHPPRQVAGNMDASRDCVGLRARSGEMVSSDLKCLVLVWSYLLEEFFKNLPGPSPSQSPGHLGEFVVRGHLSHFVFYRSREGEKKKKTELKPRVLPNWTRTTVKLKEKRVGPMVDRVGFGLPT